MQDESCSRHLENVSTQKKGKKRGRLLYSSKRELERSRMRSSKHLNRSTGVHKSLAVRIDFGEEDVTNLASLQEVLEAEEAAECTSGVNINLHGSKTTHPLVSAKLLMDF